MKKQRRLIGVIIAQVEYDYQSKIIKGLQKTAYELNYDLLVFSPFIKICDLELYQIGEKNIYSLINYEILDGIIYIPDTIQIPLANDEIINDIKIKFKGPVITIDTFIEGFMFVEADARKTIKNMVNHLIQDHNAKYINFMTGRKEHQHAIKRLDGYIDALKENNIPIEEERIHYGDFWYNEGENFIHKILNSKLPFPHAICCASDHMAISVCNALEKNGIKVPDQVAVTGYDFILESITNNPSITSAVMPIEATAIKAMKLMHKTLENTNLDIDSISTVAELQIAESCGCNIDIAKKYRSTLSLFTNSDYEYENEFFYASNYMLECLISSKNIYELRGNISWYTYQIGTFKEFYFCLCDDWDCIGYNEVDMDTKYVRFGYTDNIYLNFAKIDGEYKEPYGKFSSKEMLPSIYEKRDYPTTYFFTPIHFNDRCFGYTVLNFGNELKSYDVKYRSWIRNINNSLESLRLQNNLKWFYERMEENAIKDGLTNILNRYAFNKDYQNLLKLVLRTDKQLMIILGDLNGLKYINDTFGHIEGDNAIRMSALAFQISCNDFEKCYRFGGDEFVLVSAGYYTENDAHDKITKINTFLNNYNKTSQKPYPVSISLGYYCGDFKHDKPIEYYIKIADLMMFREKQRLKKELNLPER